MSRVSRVRWFCWLWMCGVLASSCGGEVTKLEYDLAQESSFERFRDEVQPVLTLASTDGVSRNCSTQGCHAISIGGLAIVASDEEETINTNFQQVVAKLAMCDAEDPEWPDSCKLLSDPRTGPPEHPVRSFEGADDCCYRIVRAWIVDEENPGCSCP